ncbi:MAG: hypothetical protein DRI98_06940 [Bacteroidetes bacterium]|nr:MAG: hypothetical protein DRI98_06940 [Bacteroidota bacterium]
MIKYLCLIAIIVLTACSSPAGKKKQQSDADTPELSDIKVPVYAWLGGPGKATDQEILDNFTDLKNKGIIGLLYNGGHDPLTYKRVGGIAHEVGLEFQSWIPTMIQGKNPKLPPELYAFNGLGESAWDKPAYADYYKFLCPSREEVYLFLEELYGQIADLEEVDGIHLDYIRFPDVILARGLWDKYGLVMDREYPQYDYCYCDHCVEEFQEQSGIDIRSVEDPAEVEEWKQYRYDLITEIVERLNKRVHESGKIITAAVFPGPNSVAKKIVRQEWNKWNLDAFFPMNYNDFYLEDTDWVGQVTREGVTALNNSKPLYSGLFICPKPEIKSQQVDPENHGLLPEELEDAIRESMENGAAGICLFTPGRMTEAHWEVFEKAIRTEFTIK